MKKVFYLIAILIGMSACSTDLADIEDRIKKVENQSNDLSNKSKELAEEGEKLAKEGEDLKAENEKLKDDLEKLKDSLNIIEPKLLFMEFLSSDNPLQLVENVKCEIVGDSVVQALIQNEVSNKKLIPRFKFDGAEVTIGGVKAESGVTQIDFSKPLVLTVLTPQKKKDYRVYVNSSTGLATLWLETLGRANIQTSGEYLTANVKLVENAITRAPGDVVQATGYVMGVGTINTYWSEGRVMMGKNEYILRFNNALSFFSEPKGKGWGLIANLSDNTMLRNQTGYYMGKISKLDYTPRYHYVDLMLNGIYYGTYMLGDRLEISEGRVNVGKDGYLLSVGTPSGQTSFKTNKLEMPVTIFAPSSLSTDSYNYVYGYVTAAENALYASNFKDPSSGWQKYLDIDSFVDWYLINEIAKNDKSAFKSNCMMNLKKDGKLKMGPLWDFETAFNVKYPSTGFVVKNSSWYSRLFEDPAFVSKVKERFNFFYSHKSDIISDMNSNAQYLKYSIQENNNKWKVFSATSTSTPNTWTVYQNSVLSLETWLNTRIEWLKGQFDKMA